MKIRLIGAGLGLAAASAVQASYPEKPINLILSFTPGGSTDVVARTLAQGLAEDLGKAVVVENKPGAGGAIGLTYAARTAPDGYNLYFAATTNQAITASVQGNQEVSLIDDFEPIGLVAGTSHALLVSSTLPAKTVDELVALVKAAPGKYNYASHGLGTLSHLEAELFVKETGLEMTHIPYKGSSHALPDVVSGTVAMMFDSFTGSRALVADGRLRYLAVPTSTRVSYFPDIPTLSELGVKNIEVDNLFGLFAPKGTPQDVISKLAASLERVAANPDLQKRLAENAAEFKFEAPVKMGEIAAQEHRYWDDVVKAAGIQAN